jgi:hypothetical protein
MRIALILGLLLAGSVDVSAWHRSTSEVEVLVNGIPLPKYYHKGTTYLEAIKGKEYKIRITNPIGERVAVALSVDGLNTIDARHTEARLARKWVLEPYQSIVLSGWQTSARQARRFLFTSEERSYGAWLNQKDNLGLISAEFFRERIQHTWKAKPPGEPLREQGNSHDNRKEQPRAGAADSAELQSQRNEAKAAPSAPESEYAATGMGSRIRHEVQSIYVNLEDRPFAIFNLRYEFRPVLVKLGVIPSPVLEDPLIRREKARGFRETSYCPEP